MWQKINIKWMHGFVLCLLVMAIVACSLEEEPTDEFITRQPSLQPSSTVIPNLPTEPPNEYIGRSNPTLAASPAEGQPSVEAPTQPIPTDVSLPLQVFAADSRILAMTYYRGRSSSAPIIFLLHDEGEDSRNWIAFAQHLQNQGYHVVVPDLRGSGQTGGVLDWGTVLSDMQYMMIGVDQLGTTDSTSRVGLVGVGSGANLAIVSCATLPRCSSVVSVGAWTSSPELDSQSATAQISDRSLLIVSADDDEEGTAEAEKLNIIHTGDHLWQRFGQGGLAGELFGTQPQLTQQITEWLFSTLPVS